MRIRTKVFVSHLALAATVAFICTAIVLALGLADANRRQLQQSYEQIRNINLVASNANDLAEQIAELFILGLDQTEVVAARKALRERLAAQQSLIEQELETVDNPGEWREEAAELELADAMTATVDELDRVTDEIVREIAAGRRGSAVAIYGREVEDRFEAILGAVIDKAMTRESSEVEEAIVSADELSRRSRLLAFGLVAIAGTLGLGNAVFLNRTILRPIARLAAGADAVGRGELDHIVAPTGRDELGQLAARFNHMTGQLREQHQRLQRAHESLAGEVEARTAELRARSEELEALNARLRAVDASRAQFFADISHELRTPITILRGQAEVALRRPKPTAEEQNRTLEAIVAKAAQIGRLVDDLLFLARSEEGTIGIELDTVALQDVVGDVLLDSQAMPRREGVTIRPSQPEAPILVRGDQERLRQALLIALDNALKLAPARTSVEIALACDEDRAMLRVRDEGPGFGEDEIGSAFTRFYRGTGAKARSGRGMGLGLSIAKWIVDRHGGTIAIRNGKNGGALVEIALPLAGAT